MHPTIRSAADYRALEDVPIAARLDAPHPLGVIAARAERHGERAAFVFATPGDVAGPCGVVSFADYVAGARRAANLFHELGLGPDEVVSFLLPLRAEAYFTLLGGGAAGIVNPVNPFLEDWQIAEILATAGTRILVVPAPALDEALWAKIEAVRARLPQLKAVVTVGGEGGTGTHPFAEADGLPGDRLLSGREIRGEDTVAYFHTGGTTGTPKLARHTNFMHAAQCWITGLAMGYGADDVLLTGLPLFHVGGAMVMGLAASAQGTTVLQPSPAGFRDPKVLGTLWRLVERHRATAIAGVPTVLGAGLGVPVEGADISSLRWAAASGAPLPLEVQRGFSELIGRPVFEAFGMTETTSFVTYPARSTAPVEGGVGFAMPYCEVRTARVDDERIERFCAADEIGNVVIRGPSVIQGYLDPDHDDGVVLADGWLNSGDLGRLDAAGQLFLTGRAKDMIIRGGHNIDPGIIDDVLHAHPAVEAAAAVGKPDAHSGELPVAYVQLAPGASAGAEEIQAFVRARIGERAANPVNIFIIDALPLTGVGKIFKPALRQDAIRRVYEEITAPLAAAAGRGVTVTVAADPVHGTLATIGLAGSEDADLSQAITAALAPFIVRHAVVWD